MGRAQNEAHLQNRFVAVTLKDGAVSGLRVDPLGKNRLGRAEFSRSLRPEFWEPTGATRTIRADAEHATMGPLQVWQPASSATTNGREPMDAERLLPGQTLTQTFTIPDGDVLDMVSARIPTWNTTTSGATLRLFRGDTLLVERKLVNAVDNEWQQLRPATPTGAGAYRVTLSDPQGEIGWWRTKKQEAVPEAYALRISARRAVGTGEVRLSLDGPRLTVDTMLTPTPNVPLAAPHPKAFVPWRWKTAWTKSGYDCSPKSGTVFKRFFSDTARYMPIEQLKRRDNGGLSFDNCGMIEMEGTQTADLRLQAAKLHLHWEMTDREMSLRLDTPQSVGADGTLRSRWQITALPRVDSVPDAFPRFAFADRRLTDDVNRFYWERAFTYPAPAGPAAWFEWMALMRAWNDGPPRDGEMRQLETYPITADGYVHTWYADRGWPLRTRPDIDTRHADTNARYLLACWHYWKWTGDDTWLKRQADRLRRAMRYQLNELDGKNGLLVTNSKDVQGRHNDQGNNYWDILPFGHLDAYANAVFYASLHAMAEMETALGDAPPLTNYAALRARVQLRYNRTFWDDAKGRYIGCVDVNGKRHDYGFTFLNIEALYYGLGDAEKARRIYRWMENEPTSSGKADTYTRFRFAPRATTIHNPMWGDRAPASERSDPNPSWWVNWWPGSPWEEQCQDGGAILYTSYFDLMVRTRFFGHENAWKRWNEILARYRLPDRLCGGPPLFTGEIPQQENPGQVGTDYPFAESGMVPCWLLYGVLGVEATPNGLRIAPRLPASLPWAELKGISWRGETLTIRATREVVTIIRKSRGSVAYPLPKDGSGILLR